MTQTAKKPTKKKAAKPATEVQSTTASGKLVWRTRIVGHERVDPASLVANPHNFRTHPQAQRDALAQAINQLGFLRSVTVNKRTGNLVDGHERVWQALLTEQPLIDVEYVDLNAAEEKAALATMDPISEMATVDAAKLKALLNDVLVSGDALQQMLADLAEATGATENAMITEDVAPEPPANPITKPGDLWLLGSHRLVCGDSTNPENVSRVLGGRVPFIMVTDPPYGVEYDPEWRHRVGINNSDRTGKVSNDDRVDWTTAWRLFSGNIAYVWHGGLHSAAVQESLLSAGFLVRAQIVWVKPRLVISRGHYHWQHEPAFHAERSIDATGGGRCQGVRGIVVCGTERHNCRLGRRSQADHRLGYRIHQRTGNSARNPEACRMHGSAYPKPRRQGRRHIRPVSRVGNHDNRSRAVGSQVLRTRVGPGLL